MKSRLESHREHAARAAEEARNYRASEARLREAARARPSSAASLNAAEDQQLRRADWSEAKWSR